MPCIYMYIYKHVYIQTSECISWYICECACVYCSCQNPTSICLIHVHMDICNVRICIYTPYTWCVCTYICIHYMYHLENVCMSTCHTHDVCVHTYIHTHMRLIIDLNKSNQKTGILASIHVYVHIHIHAYIHTCIKLKVWNPGCNYTCICTYTYIHTYIHTCIKLKVWNPGCNYTCIYVHIHIHTYTHASNQQSGILASIIRVNYMHTHTKIYMYIHTHTCIKS